MHIELRRRGDRSQLLEPDIGRPAPAKSVRHCSLTGKAVSDIGPALVHPGSGIPNGAQDSAPVWIAATPTRSYQRTVSHSTGSNFGIAPSFGVSDANCDKSRHPLTIPNNHLRQFEA